MTRKMICQSHEDRNMKRDSPGMLLDLTTDTSRHTGESLDKIDSSSFWTSTPTRFKESCMECRKECLAKRHYAINTKVGT